MLILFKPVLLGFGFPDLEKGLEMLARKVVELEMGFCGAGVEKPVRPPEAGVVLVSLV